MIASRCNAMISVGVTFGCGATYVIIDGIHQASAGLCCMGMMIGFIHMLH